MDINFPSDKIRDKWIANMKDFVSTFKKPKWFDNAESEIQFLYEIDKCYLQGFIDIVEFLDDGYINILDWKTSSKFAKKDLVEKGRQLIIYGIAMEQLGYKINSIGWYMLKYCVVSWHLKNGKIKEKVCERGFWISEIKNEIIKDLKELNYDDFDIELILDKAIEINDIKLLPQQIQDKYSVKDYIQYYDYTQENINECKEFILNRIQEIEDNSKNELYWLPKEIDYSNCFYCENLCNQRKKCEYIENYHKKIKELRESLEVKDDFDNLDDILS